MSSGSRWAVVIGLNDYVMPGASLKGAVSDAIKICQWLLDPDGGGVPRKQLILALHPVAPTLDPALASILNSLDPPLACPNKDKIVDLFLRVVQKTGGEGERLYVYLSGHGMQYEVTPERFESAIVAPDCDSLHPDRSLTVTSILDYFEGTRFLDQFFFIDTCRNVPWTGRFEAGRISAGPPCDPPTIAPQQFVCLATSEGEVAVELKAAGYEGGAFTEALLRGLAGEGSAKAFDEADRFVVRWNRLFEFVCATVQATQRTLPNGKKLVQIPRDEGSKRGADRPADPELWSVPAASAKFPTVNLSVTIDPPAAVAACSITASDLFDDAIPPAAHRPPTTNPTVIPLPPRWYRVLPKSAGFQYAKRSGMPVELMASREISLRLEPGVTLHEPVSVPAPAASYTPPGIRRAIPGAAPPGHPQPPQKASLIIDPGDPLTPWELLDTSGKEVWRGLGRKEHSVEAGLYRLLTTAPESAPTETLIELQPGANPPVELPATPPSDAVQQLGKLAGFEHGSRQRIGVSEALGMIGNVELSTILALAATVASFASDPGFGHKLRKINLTSLPAEFPPGTTAGMMVVFGAEERLMSQAVEERKVPIQGPTAVQELDAVRVAWWPSGATPPTEGQPIDIRNSAPAIGQWFTFSQSGHGWLAISALDRPPTLFNLFLPARCISTVIVHRMANGEVGVYLYSLQLGDATPEALQQTRFLDLAQRYMLRGRYEYPPDPDELPKKIPDDPISLLLAAYLWQRRGDQNRTRTLVMPLLERYPTWSDLHLIQAESFPQRNESAALDAYKHALDSGVPIFAGGLARLLQAILRFDVQHPKRAALERIAANRVPGVLWTAVTALHNS